MNKSNLYYVVSLLMPVVFLGFTSLADSGGLSSDWFSAPDRGLIIAPNLNSDIHQVGDSVTVSGRIKLVGKSKGSQINEKQQANSDDKSGKNSTSSTVSQESSTASNSSGLPDKNQGSANGNHNTQSNSEIGLLEKLKNEGITLSASFPNNLTDISSEVVFANVSEQEISYSYRVPSLKKNDNQFNIQIFRSGHEGETLRKLLKIQTKLLRHISAIEEILKKKQLEENVSKKLNRLKAQLEKVSSKIVAKSQTSGVLIAESVQTFQVDNERSSFTFSSQSMGKYFFTAQAEPGVAIEGMTAKIKSSILNLRKGSLNEGDDQDDLVIAKIYWNNTLIKEIGPQPLSPQEKIDFEFNTERLRPNQENMLRAELYGLDDEATKLGKRKGWIELRVPVAADTIAPEWLSVGNKPENPYTQNLEAIILNVGDRFGRLDADTLGVKVSGQSLTGANVDLEVSSKLTRESFSDGSVMRFSGDINPLAEGDYKLAAQIKDLAGNQSSIWSFDFHIDRTPPIINLDLSDGLLTNTAQHLVAVEVLDHLDVWTKIVLNGTTYLSDVPNKTFSFVLTLQEGVNTVEVISTDLAGNSTTKKLANIVLDTVPPVLTDLLPKDGTTFQTVNLQVSGKSNEKLKSVTVNELSWPVAADALSFSGNFVAQTEGAIDLEIEASDLVGNIAQYTIPIVMSLQPLNANLIQIVPNSEGTKLIVQGGPGTTRPNFKVTVASSFFNYESTIADASGGFSITIDPFTEATVSVVDPANGRKYMANITFGSPSDVLLAGKVMTTFTNSPDPAARKGLANVTVSIAGTTISTVTDASGSFLFSRAKLQKFSTGNQILLINGATAILPAEDANLKYGSFSVPVTLGVTQKNVLLEPIYLAPLILDGSEKIISKESGGVVTSPHAAGVELIIPPEAAQFPSGATSSAVTLQTIPAEFSIIQTLEFTKPATVVALEPSGTTFSKPVPIAFPNNDDLPPGTEMVVMLLNSSSGKWEIAAGAKVSENGQSIRTKEGMGIKHFSLSYATPMGPMAMERKDNDKSGASVFDGSMTTKIALPTFKSLGQDIGPSLIYKSSWAHPTATISNLLDLPDRSLELPPPTTGVLVDKFAFDVPYCIFLQDPVGALVQLMSAMMGGSPCTTKKEEYYRTIETLDLITVNRVYTDKVTAEYSFMGTKSEKFEFNGTPKRATLSYALDLKDVPSGIYPYSSHYEIKLKHQVIGTRQITKMTDLSGGSALLDDPKTAENESIIKFDVDNPIDSIFPPDLTGQIYVQNKGSSESGQGWKISGLQQILNPKDDQILLEEADGSLSTYAVENTIETLFNGTVSGADLNGGYGISQWPWLLVKDRNANRVLKFDLTKANSQPVNSYSMLRSLGGRIAGYQFNYTDEITKVGREVCTERYSWPGGNYCSKKEIVYDTFHNYKSVCSSEIDSFSISPKTYKFLLSPEGLLYGTDLKMNAVFSANTSVASTVLGLTRPAPVFGKSDWNKPPYDFHGEIIKSCADRSLDCQLVSKSGPTILDGQYKCGTAPRSTGTVPIKGSEVYTGSFGIRYSKTGLNEPMGIAPGPNLNQPLVIADSGNHRVALLDYTYANYIKYVAGSGNYLNESMASGPATSLDIKHPNDVVYDSAGNLYISSKSGLIRKVDPNGYMKVIAGNLTKTTLAAKTSLEDVQLADPHGLAFDNTNNFLYVADTGNNRIVRLDLNRNEAITIAGRFDTGSSISFGDGGPALAANLNAPREVALDDRGNLIIGDSGNQRIRRVNFQGADGGPLTFASTNRDGSHLYRNADGTWQRIHKDLSKVTFYENGLQKSAISAQGLVTNYDYEGDRIKTITLPTNQSIKYHYANGKLDYITDAAGRETVFFYNQLGQLIKVQYPDQTQREFGYTESGLLTSETDQLQKNTTYTYNNHNRMETITRPNQPPIAVSDSSSNTAVDKQVETVLDPETNQPITRITDAKGNVTEFKETFDGLVETIKDADGKVTKMEYDTLGRVTKLTPSSGKAKTIEYVPATDLVSLEVDEESRKSIKIDYNEKGQIKSQELKSLDDPNFVKRSSRTYTSNGLLDTENDPRGISTSYQYPSSTDALRVLPTKITTSKGSLSNWQAREFDSNGNIKKVTDSSGDEVSWTYDDAGNPLTKTIKGVPGYYQYSYDKWNRLTKVVSPKNEETVYSYSPRGELAQVQDPKGFKIKFGYDDLGRVISKTNQQEKSWFYEYDANDNLAKETDPKLQVKSYEYSKTNRLAKKILPDDLIAISYDENQNVSSIENAKAIVNYQYDFAKRVARESVQGKSGLHSWDVDYSYNIDDQVSAMVSTYYGSNSYTYNNLLQLSHITNFKGESFDFGYDNLGRLNAISRLNMVTKFNFGPDQKLSAIENISGNVTKSSLSYQYHPSNLIASMTHSLGMKQSFSYNENNFLTGSTYSSAIERAPGSVGLQDESYSYDSLGNRISDANGTLNFDPTGQELSEDYKYRYSSDANGNLIQRHNKLTGEWMEFTYNSDNQLIGVRFFAELTATTPTKTVAYSYDPLGRRLEKKVFEAAAQSDQQKTFTRRFVYDGQEIIAELDGDNNLLARYTHSRLRTDDVLAVDITEMGVNQKLATTAGSYSFLKDHLGSIREVANSSGEIVQRNHYSAFGTIIARTDSNDVELTAGPILNTNFAFTGREFDQETGFYYYRARYYDPSVGRFLQKDPDPGKLGVPITVINSYAYALNAPTKYTDPQGKFPWLLIALISLGQTIFENNQHGGNFLEQFGKNFAINSIMTWIGGNVFSGAEFSASMGETFITAGKSLLIQATVNSTLWELDDRKIIGRDTGRALLFLSAGYRTNDDITLNQSYGNLLTGGSAEPGNNHGILYDWASSMVPGF